MVHDRRLSTTNPDTRLFKESDSYRFEAEAQKRKLDKLTADRDEDWDIKNAVSILNLLQLCGMISLLL